MFSTPLVSSSSTMEGGERRNALIPCNLGVMVVDEDPITLLLMSTMLKTCNYRVVTFSTARDALYHLWKEKANFDLVITEIHMDKANGFCLLYCIVTQLDIPVITMCNDDDPQLQSQALMNGACFHLTKPINMTKMEVVWQKGWKKNRAKRANPFTLNPLERWNFRNFDYNLNNNKVKIVEDGFGRDRKRPRLQWDRDLHRRFLVAVRLLGENAIPTKIIDVMNMEGLTNKQISSHLQKYRKRLAKLNEMDEEEQNYCLPNIFRNYTKPASLKPVKKPIPAKKSTNNVRDKVRVPPKPAANIPDWEASIVESAPIGGGYSNVPAFAATNESGKMPALDDDWAEFDVFAELDTRQACDEGFKFTGGGEGTSADQFPFPFDFDIGDVNFDEFLSQILNDKV